MAVAGFSPAELDITVQENTLLVTGKAQKEDGERRRLLAPRHRPVRV
jgi:molecular chaperone IbpA